MKLQNPRPGMQIECYYLAVHENTHKCTLEYTEFKKQIVEKVWFLHFLLLSHWLYHSLPTKAVIELVYAQNDIAFITEPPFSPFVHKLATATVLASYNSANF